MPFSGGTETGGVRIGGVVEVVVEVKRGGVVADEGRASSAGDERRGEKDENKSGSFEAREEVEWQDGEGAEEGIEGIQEALLLVWTRSYDQTPG